MRIGRRRSRLHDEDVATANIFIDLKVELAVREALRVRFPHVTIQLATNLFGQLGIRITTKDLATAGCAHSQSERLAGAGGFEPTNAGSKDRCLTTWLR